MNNGGNRERLFHWAIVAFVLAWLGVAGTALADNGRRAHGAPAAKAHKGKGQKKASRGRQHRGTTRSRRRSRGRPSRSSRPRKHRSPTRRRGSDGTPPAKVTLCHATHSDKNPYVEITISERALKAHQRHQDDEDIVPAPAGGCPGPSGDESTEPGSPPADDPSDETPASGGPPVTGQPGPTEPVEPSGTLGEQAQGGEAGEQANGGDTPSGDPAGRVAGANAAGGSGGNLPFTGLALLALIALGTASLLSGVGIRKAIGRS